MRIVHICPNAPYNEGWGYQENLLPKYHKKLGHDVTLIISNKTHSNGKIIEIPCTDYLNEDGVRVIRMKRKEYIIKTLTKLHSKMSVYNLLIEISPDFIFFHGMVSSTIYDVVRYKKKVNVNCVIVQDNHLDYNIGMSKKDLKHYLIRSFYRQLQNNTKKYVSKVYGVTPWRKEYAEDFFCVDKSKTDILLMGADDENIDFVNRETIRKNIRERYGISEKEFLIVTGGKIDKNKQIDLLMRAISSTKNVKLIIFGTVLDDTKIIFEKLICDNSNIIYIGWIDASKVYDYFFAADLVCFPGQHSVLWEQACAAKVPCVFKKWKGMEHINNGGNSDIIDNVTVESLKQKINSLIFSSQYYKMLDVASSEKTDIYLYSDIAKKSLEAYYESLDKMNT